MVCGSNKADVKTGREESVLKKEGKKVQDHKNINRTLYFFIVAMCGFFVGILMAKGIKKGDFLSFILNLVFCLIVLYIAVFIHLVIHELGHLIFGLLSGYRFASFRIGNIIFLKKDGRMQRKKYSLMGTGGQCLMAPPPMVDGKIPYILYNLGGVLMNLILSVLCMIPAFALPRDSRLASVFWLISLAGIAMAFMNGVPMKTGAVDNDGRNIISIGKSKAAMRCFWLQMMIYVQTVENIRLKDMPEEWFLVPTDEDLKNSLCATVGAYACSRAMDQMDFVRADRMMEELLNKQTGMVNVHKNMLIAERIFCELVGEKRPEVLSEFMTSEFNKFLKAMKNNPSVLRMQYAYALLGRKDKDEAEKIRMKFEKVVKAYPYEGEVESERDLLTYITKSQ